MREASWLADTDTVVVVLEPEVKPKMSHAERVAGCGTRWAHRIDVGSGKYRRTIFYCECWRECAGCLERRALKYRARIENMALDGVEVRYVELSKGAAEALSHELGKDNILRCPMGELEGCFVTGTEVGVPVADVTEELDWIALVNTPKGRRMSGSLGLVAPSGTKTETITIESVVSNASDELTTAAVKYSIDESSELRPTRETVRSAIHQRLSLYKDYLETNGAHCSIRRITVTVPPTIDWGLDSGYYVEGGY